MLLSFSHRSTWIDDDVNEFYQFCRCLKRDERKKSNKKDCEKDFPSKSRKIDLIMLSSRRFSC